MLISVEPLQERFHKRQQKRKRKKAGHGWAWMGMVQTGRLGNWMQLVGDQGLEVFRVSDEVGTDRYRMVVDGIGR